MPLEDKHWSSTINISGIRWCGLEIQVQNPENGFQNAISLMLTATNIKDKTESKKNSSLLSMFSRVITQAAPPRTGWSTSYLTSSSSPQDEEK